VTAITTYTVVKSLHIMAVIGAYGLPMAYPLLLPFLRRRHPRAMPGAHDVQHHLNRVLTGPGTVLILGFGIYLASKQHLWHEFFVQFGLGAILAIGAIGGWVVQASKRMAELSAADVAATPEGSDPAWGVAYEALYRRYARVELLLALVVLATVFVMTTKP